MIKANHHFFQLISAIVIMSSSGVLARSVDISPELAIWVRSLLGVLVLFVSIRLMGLPTWTGPGKPLMAVVLSTILFGIHWVTYFYALYFSNVAVGMLSLFTFPVMTAILEPLIVKSKFSFVDLILALIAFAGVYFLVPEFDLNNKTTQGVLIGLFSALTYSLRNLTLKLHVKEHSGITLMFMQLLGLVVLLSPTLFYGGYLPNLVGIRQDWLPLLILGVFTTAIGHTMFVMSFKNFSITMISILSTLTPLIGIGLGMYFLNEIPENNIWIGAGLISVAVIAESMKAIRSTG
ncbi:MAG: DMT family transporter [Reichenbachiella sp.]|uniref:DMT family transporter n=1 Tax=Reichenbachiella sp. TaxID=2184521 RepID=UPI003262D6E1